MTKEELNLAWMFSAALAAVDGVNAFIFLDLANVSKTVSRAFDVVDVVLFLSVGIWSFEKVIECPS